MCDFVLRLCEKDLKPDDIAITTSYDNLEQYDRDDLIVCIGKLRAEIELLAKKYELVDGFLRTVFSDLLKEIAEEQEQADQQQEEQQQEDEEKKSDPIDNFNDEEKN